MIITEHITKRYGANTALDDVGFTIERGEAVGLLGLNGAGKSTVMNILTGYVSPSAGRALIGGYDIVSEPVEAKRLIGYLPESPSFYSDMRVNEFLFFICGLKGVKKNRAERVGEICERVGIGSVTGRLIRNLSKGYRQRVGLAQSLIGDPEVLILDEPTVGLDPSQIIEIRALIKSVGKNSTVIVSSHILSDIQAVCSRIIILDKGRIVADGSSDMLGGTAETAADSLEDKFIKLVKESSTGGER